jgi:hypothetical protein
MYKAQLKAAAALVVVVIIINGVLETIKKGLDQFLSSHLHS